MMLNNQKTLINNVYFKSLLMLIIYLSVISNLNADKYAGEIFKMGAGVRNFALGRVGLTDNQSPAIAYWNSALLEYKKANTFEIMHAEEFSGLLKYDTVSGSFGDNNSIAFTLSRIAVNNISLTKLPNPDEEISETNRPYKYKSVNNADYILYVGFSRQLWNIPIGFSPKIVYRNLANTPAYGFGLDISTLIKSSDKLSFAFKIRDIIPSQIYWDNGTKESVNIGFDIETKISSNFLFLVRHNDKDEYPLSLYINTEINTENIRENSFLNLGEFSVDPHIGAELNVHQNLRFLLGYDIEYITTGLQLNYKKFLLNYAFKQNTDLDNSHRFSIGYQFN